MLTLKWVYIKIMTSCHIAFWRFIMVKKTFYNLSEEKRERIINAVKKEFAENPREKVSINRIIKEANISRGSFYQYFDDKVDLVELLSLDFKKNVMVYAINQLKCNDGNIFIVYENMFDSIVSEIKEEDNSKFYKNILTHLKVNGNLFSDFMQYRLPDLQDKIQNDKTIDNYINTRYLNCRTREEVFHILNILNLVIINSVFSIFVKQSPIEKERQSFFAKLNLMRKGFEHKNI